MNVKCLCKKVKRGPKKKSAKGKPISTKFKDGPLAVSKAAQFLARNIVAGMHTREADAMIHHLNAQLRTQEKMAKTTDAAVKASRADAEAAREATEINAKAEAAREEPPPPETYRSSGPF